MDAGKKKLDNIFKVGYGMKGASTEKMEGVLKALDNCPDTVEISQEPNNSAAEDKTKLDDMFKLGYSKAYIGSGKTYSELMNNLPIK